MANLRKSTQHLTIVNCYFLLISLSIPGLLVPSILSVPVEAKELNRAALASEANRQLQIAEDLIKDGEDASYWLESVLSIYRKLGDLNSEALIFEKLGDAYIPPEQQNAVDRLQKIINFYQKAPTFYRQTGNRFGEANILYKLGKITFEQEFDKYYEGVNLSEDNNTIKTEKYQKSLKLFETALNIYKTINHKTGEAKTLQKIGLIHFTSKDFLKAEMLWQQALIIVSNYNLYVDEPTKLDEDYIGLISMLPQESDPLSDLALILSISSAQIEQGRITTATELLDVELTRARKNNDIYAEVYILRQLGYIYRKNNEYKGIETLRESLELSRRLPPDLRNAYSLF